MFSIWGAMVEILALPAGICLYAILRIFTYCGKKNRSSRSGQGVWQPNGMARLSCQDVDTCSRAVRALYAEPSLKEFPQRALAILSDVVPVSYATYNEITLQPRHMSVVYLPDRPEAASLVPRLEALVHTHPLAGQIHSTEPRRIVDVTTVRRFRETPVFREYYRYLNVTDQIGFSLEEGKQTRVMFVLNRDGTPFSARDRGVVSFLSPHFSQAYRNARAGAQLLADISKIGEGLAAIERAVLLATEEGRIVWSSGLAREWLLELFAESMKSGLRLPPAFITRMSLEKPKPVPPKSFFELQLAVNPEERLTARFIATPPGKFVIILDRERSAIGPKLVDSLGLTRREGEVLFWISEAKADCEIAAILGISPRTVHKHVEHLFAKTGISNRGAAQRLGLDLRRI